MTKPFRLIQFTIKTCLNNFEGTKLRIVSFVLTSSASQAANFELSINININKQKFQEKESKKKEFKVKNQ